MYFFEPVTRKGNSAVSNPGTAVQSYGSGEFFCQPIRHKLHPALKVHVIETYRHFGHIQVCICLPHLCQQYLFIRKNEAFFVAKYIHREREDVCFFCLGHLWKKGEQFEVAIHLEATGLVHTGFQTFDSFRKDVPVSPQVISELSGGMGYDLSV